MNLSEHKQLAELLRQYFLEFAELPVQPGSFSLDGLLPQGPSMSLQITGGQTVDTYISGRRNELLAFTIFYRGDVVNDNDAKSAMIGILNGIGEWLESQELPYFGASFKVTDLKQVQTANLVDQSEQHITYQAGFTLGYTTK